MAIDRFGDGTRGKFCACGGNVANTKDRRGKTVSSYESFTNNEAIATDAGVATETIDSIMSGATALGYTFGFA